MSATHSTVATGTNDGSKQVSVDAWNEDHVIDAAGLDFPGDTTAPSAPSAGSVRVFGHSSGGRMMAAIKGPTGLHQTLQPHIGETNIFRAYTANNSATITTNGFATFTTTGTVTATVYATTSRHTRNTRLDYLVTAASNTAVAGFRHATALFRGTEGYHAIMRVCPATGVTVATRRAFFGFGAATTAPTDVQPSSIVNTVGVGYDAADTNWQLMFNDGSGTATKVDTGIARPTTDRQTVYTVCIYVPPGGASATVSIEDEDTGSIFESTATTDLITATTAVAPRGWVSVGGTSSVIGVTLFDFFAQPMS